MLGTVPSASSLTEKKSIFKKKSVFFSFVFLFRGKARLETEQMAAGGTEPDAPAHADERLGDAIMLAVLLFAFCAYWPLSRKPQGLWVRQEERGRERPGDNARGANEVYVRAAAHVPQDFWD